MDTREQRLLDLSHRQKAIFEQAKSEGSVQVETLADQFNVTVQTIRRDLNHLYQAHLLQRVHGGAIIWDSVENLGYGARKILAAEGKARIGKLAADLIPNDCSIFINIGTTTEQLAESLIGHQGILAITNNLNVLNTLRSRPQFEVMTAGGLVRNSDGGIVGDQTVEFIQQFRADYAVIGASAIELSGTVLDFDLREVRVAQAMIEHARSVILLADSNKFERNAPMRIGELDLIDIFVTDLQPPDEFMQSAKEHNVIVHVCDE